MEDKLISLVNSAGIAPGMAEVKKTPLREEETVNFAQLLNEHKKALEPQKTSSGQELSSDPVTGKEAKAQEERKKQETSSPQAHLDIQKELLPLLRYMELLGKRHPDTLSPTEKKLLSMEQKVMAGVGLKDLPKILAEKGLRLADLTQGEMARLLDKKNLKEVNAFLEQLLKEGKKEKGREYTAAELLIEDKGGSLSQKAKSKENEQIANQLNREEVIRQIVDKMEIRNLEKGTETVLRLNPEFLGDLKVKLLIEPDKVTAEFHTTSAQVKNLLLENREELTAGLEKKGLRLDDLRAELVEEIS